MCCREGSVILEDEGRLNCDLSFSFILIFQEKDLIITPVHTRLLLSHLLFENLTMATVPAVVETCSKRVESLLYHLTVVDTNVIVKLVTGSFTRPGMSEVIRAKPDSLELCRLDYETSALTVISRLPLFATLLNIVAVPFPTYGVISTFPDAFAITTDSGKITLMKYALIPGRDMSEDSLGEWRVLDSLNLGRSGVRVTVPGHFLAVDPGSHGIFVGAPLKSKYLIPLKAGKDDKEESMDKLESEDEGRLRFRSPIDVTRGSVLFDMVALDIAAEQSPQFAVLESLLPQDDAFDPEIDSQDKMLTFYEFSFSLNQMLRVLSLRVPASSHKLIPVPLERGGPGGVLVCTDTDLQWESVSTNRVFTGGSAPPVLRIPIPRRSDLESVSMDPMTIAHCCIMVSKGFFLMMQTELGDLFRVQLDTRLIERHFLLDSVQPPLFPSSMPETDDKPLSIKYFDTIPPAVSMVLLKKGFLCVASETSPHALYSVVGDGARVLTKVRHVRIQLQPSSVANPLDTKPTGKATLKFPAPTRYVVYFDRHCDTAGRAVLKNLKLLEEFPNSNGTLGMHANLDAQSRLKFSRLSGRSGHSGVHTVRYGIATNHVSTVPLQVPFDTIIALPAKKGLLTPGLQPMLVLASSEKVLLSSPQGTAVLNLSERGGMDWDSVTGFLGPVQTLAASTVVEGRGFIQVHTKGFHVILPSEPNAPSWTPPDGKPIISAACNSHQIVVSLDNGGIRAFDLGPAGNKLRATAFQPLANAKAISIFSTSSELCAVATIAGAISVLRMNDLTTAWEIKTTKLEVNSILLTNLGDPTRLFLLAGFNNGKLAKWELLPNGMSIQGKETFYYCGTTPVKLSQTEGLPYCLVASSELWRCSSVDGAFRIAPVIVHSNPSAVPTTSGTTLYACVHNPNSKQRLDLLLGCSGKTLSLNTVHADQQSSSMYSISSCPLKVLSAKRLVSHPTRPNAMIALCTEYRGYSPSDLQILSEKFANGAPVDVNHWLMHDKSPNPKSKFASSIHVYDADTNTALPGYFLNDDEAALCMTIGSFAEFGKESVLCVGCARNYDSGHGDRAPTWGETSIRTFRFSTTSPTDSPIATFGAGYLIPHFVTMLPEKDLPSAIHISSSGGFLLVGFGPREGLHMYHSGTKFKQLLRTRRLKDTFNSRIVSIDTIRDVTTEESLLAAGYSDTQAKLLTSDSSCTLILCGLQDQSVMIARHYKVSGQTHFMVTVGVDPLPKFISTCCFVDDRTVALGDKFGGLFVVRIPESNRLLFPEKMDNMSDEEIDRAVEHRRDQPLVTVNSFHVGQIVTSLQVVQRQGATALVYCTVLGKIGALIPFPSEEDAATAVYIDPLLSEYFTSPVGRSLLHHRSRMSPKLHVVDGDCIQLLAQSKEVFFATDAKEEIQERMERITTREANHRKLIGLPPRQLTRYLELPGKMKAIIGLSE